MPSASGPLITARGLTKRFVNRKEPGGAARGGAHFLAVDGIDFDVQRGEAFGLLGPNGAGKTSTMRMIGCVSPPTSGTLTVFGLDPHVDGSAIKARLGVVPQRDNLDTEVTVRENLLIYARYFDIPTAVAHARADALLDFVQLTERAHSEVEPLSGGMKRRLTVARGLINEPEIILLDEPTTGLDPQARHLIWDRLYRLKRDGATLVLTTHYMDEAEQLCDRLVIMDKGRIIAEGHPRTLIERFSTREVVELWLPEILRTDLASRLAGLCEHHEVRQDRVLLYTTDGERCLAELHSRGVVAERALVRRSTLEDVFMRLTGHALVD